MRGFKTVLQGLLGIVLACCAAAATSTWLLSGENDLLFQWRGFRISACGLGAGISLLVTLLFANGWIAARKRRHPEGRGMARLMNGLGFGLLPGAAVWKAFEQETFLGAGTPVPAGLPQAPWLTEQGICFPSRTEMLLALLLFAAACLWLFLRKNDLPENGDLMGVCAAIWAAGRTVTEGLRAGQTVLFEIPWAAGWAALAVMAIVLTGWTVRAFRQKKNTGYAYACIPVFAVTGTLLVLLQKGILLSYNAPAALAAEVCCALLAVKAVLCMGRVTRAEA